LTKFEQVFGVVSLPDGIAGEGLVQLWASLSEASYDWIDLMRDGIFVSYSHSNRDWLGQFHNALGHRPDGVRVDAWGNTRIIPGACWHGEIKQALDTAAQSCVLPGEGHTCNKMPRATTHQAFEGNEKMRENTLVFLQGQQHQATATRLMEEISQSDVTPVRNKAVVRMLEQVDKDEELALRRATELTQDLANQAVAMLNEAWGINADQH